MGIWYDVGSSAQSSGPIVIQPDNSVTEARYIGSLCAHHPDLKGLRLKKNHLCLQCHRDRKADYRNQPRIRDKRAAMRASGLRQAREDQLNADRLATTIRLRAIEIAKRSGAHDYQYQDFWDQARREIAASPP